MPKILLVSDVMPDPNGGGGSVYLDALAAECAPGGLALGRILVAKKDPSPASSPMPLMKVSAPDPKRVGAWLPSLLRRPFRFGFELLVGLILTPGMARRLSRFGRQQGVDFVWVPLSSPYTLRLALPVARRLGIPLIVTVWDPPAYKLPRFGLRGRLLQRYLAMFDATVRHASCCAVMSEEMKRRYESLYKTRCVVLNHGLEERDWRDPKLAPADPARFVIGFAGSLYARREMEALVEALAGVDWRWQGREVMLRLLTGPSEVPAAVGRHADHVESLGWRDLHSTLDVLAECDVCYLPYWMNPEHSEVVQLAFPTKFSTYLASGCPVFFHGPRESSPSRFMEQYPAGVVCHSLDPEAILAALQSLWIEPGRYSEATRIGRQALQDKLGRDVFRRSLAQILEAGGT